MSKPGNKHYISAKKQQWTGHLPDHSPLHLHLHLHPVLSDPSAVILLYVQAVRLHWHTGADLRSHTESASCRLDLISNTLLQANAWALTATSVCLVTLCRTREFANRRFTMRTGGVGVFIVPAVMQEHKSSHHSAGNDSNTVLSLTVAVTRTASTPSSHA